MKRLRTFFTAAFVLPLLLAWPSPLAAAEPLIPPAPIPAGVAPTAMPVEQKLPEKKKRQKTADEFFVGPIVHLDITLSPEQWANLKAENREYALCTIVETAPDGTQTTYTDVGVKLKGAAGSFQPPERKPGLTINMDKFKDGQRFHGMDKFHLNNSMQDRTFLNEFISGEWCRAAGVPASRCTHVLVKWNGKDNGLYVFKEGFTKDFLTYFYEQNDGSLYDGHFISEVDGNLEKQMGDVNDRSDLKGLAEACKEPDEKLRWQKLYERLDVDAYLRFLALESFLCHWDGYNYTKNNYRVYFDAKTGKGAFFAHGMDNLLNDANGQLFRYPVALVGSAVLSNPEWRAHYRRVLDALYTKVIQPADWGTRIEEQGKRVQEALARQDPQKAQAFASNIRSERQRVQARVTGIGRILADPAATFGTPPNSGRQNQNQPQPPPGATVAFKDGVAKLGLEGWRGGRDGNPREVEVDGQKALYVRADETFTSNYRRRVRLEPGRYRFEGLVKLAAVDSAPENGAMLTARLGQNPAPVPPGLRGTLDWQKVACEFDATGAEITLGLDLRASAGEAWFRTDSLQLVKLK